MTWQVSAMTVPGSDSDNEDWYGVGPGVAVVLDGLSSPSGDNGCRHGTPWYVRQLGGVLLNRLLDSGTPDPAHALARAIEQVADLHRGECDLKHPGTPSSTVLVLVRVEERYRYLVLSDSTIVYRSSSGVSAISDKSVDNVLQEEQKAVKNASVGSQEHEDALAHLVREQRKVRNSDSGYWVASVEPAAVTHALTGRLPVDVRQAALLSDGAARLVDDYELTDWSGVLDLVAAGGPAGLIRQVRDADEADAEGKKHGRFKTSDDATVVYLEAVKP